MNNNYYLFQLENSHSYYSHKSHLNFPRTFADKEEEDFIFSISKSILDNNFDKFIKETETRYPHNNFLGLQLPKSLVDGLFFLEEHKHFINQFKIYLIELFIEKKLPTSATMYSYVNNNQNGRITKKLIEYYEKNRETFLLYKAQLITFYFLLNIDSLFDQEDFDDIEQEIIELFENPFEDKYYIHYKNKFTPLEERKQSKLFSFYDRYYENDISRYKLEVKKYFEEKFQQISNYKFDFILQLYNDFLNKSHQNEYPEVCIHSFIGVHPSESYLLDYVYYKLTGKPKINFFSSFEDIKMNLIMTDSKQNIQSKNYINDFPTKNNVNIDNYYKSYISLVKKIKDMDISNKDSNCGIIYIMTNNTYNQSGQRLLKIGITNNICNRRRSLSNTSSPRDFEIIYSVQCSNFREIESDIKHEFHDQRESNNREFYNMELQEIINYIHNNIKLEFS